MKMYHFSDKRTKLLAEMKSIIMVNKDLINAQQDVEKALEHNQEMLFSVLVRIQDYTKANNDREN